MDTLKHKQPKFFVFENVKGLINHDKGKTLEIIAQSFSEVGYCIDIELLNSKYFGVPQNRERIYIVGIREDLIEQQEWDIPKERKDVMAKGKRSLKESGVKMFNFDFPKQEKVIKMIRDILESNVDEKYYLSEDKTKKLVEKLESYKNGTILSNDYKEPKKIDLKMVGRIDINGNDSLRRVYSTDGVAPTLTTMEGGHREPKIVEYKYRIRKSTPLECWRLQAFSDEDFYKAKKALINTYYKGKDRADSQLYKQAGNSITVTVLEEIFKNLLYAYLR